MSTLNVDVNHLVTPSIPTGWRRKAFRAPIFLYKNGLGWLLGNRFLLVNHTGRKTGLPRQAVVEVVDRDPIHNHYLIAAGFGRKTNWYRNLLSTPEMSFQIGQQRWHASAVPLSGEEAGQVLVDYARRYPHLFPQLTRMIGIVVDAENETAVRDLGRSGVLPIMRLEPHGSPEQRSLLPGTPVLAAAASIIALIGWKLRRR